MIKVNFLNNGGIVCGFEISGHTGYADKGYDIVCASVSSAVQMSANTITEVIGTGTYVSRIAGKITLCLMRNTDCQKATAAKSVLEGLRLHLSLLSKQFRGTISIEDSEV